MSASYGGARGTGFGRARSRVRHVWGSAWQKLTPRPKPLQYHSEDPVGRGLVDGVNRARELTRLGRVKPRP